LTLLTLLTLLTRLLGELLALSRIGTSLGRITLCHLLLLQLLSQLLCKLTGHDVQPNKAIVGKNAFAHEAGIHQDGMLKNPLTYEIMTPQSVGVPKNELVLGKHSGRRALDDKLKSLGFHFSKDELNGVYTSFIALADEKKTITDIDLIHISTIKHQSLNKY
jgi:2-isopropylmalate synthase